MVKIETMSQPCPEEARAWCASKPAYTSMSPTPRQKEISTSTEVFCTGSIRSSPLSGVSTVSSCPSGSVRICDSCAGSEVGVTGFVLIGGW